MAGAGYESLIRLAVSIPPQHDSKGLFGVQEKLCLEDEIRREMNLGGAARGVGGAIAEALRAAGLPACLSCDGGSDGERTEYADDDLRLPILHKLEAEYQPASRRRETKRHGRPLAKEIECLPCHQKT